MTNKIFIFQTSASLFHIIRQKKNVIFEKNHSNFLNKSFMIIVKFGAGLGNQMLQYASYLALQKRYPNAKIKADIQVYNFSKIHNGLELERLFPIELDVMMGKRANKVSKIGKYWYYAQYNLVKLFFKTRISKFRYVRDKGVLNENLFHLDVSKKYYLEGQWGNEKYFNDVMELVREQFTFKIPLDTINNAWAEQIKSTTSVSVHIRRGDYIGAESFVELCKSDYYGDAFRHLTQATDQPKFYIFSDDVKWCRENLTWLKEYDHYFIEGNKGKNSYKDMQLMTICKHNIIANSTFSWWGGWLNRNNNKIVICPQKLFYDEIKNEKIVAEFYPESWVKM